MDDFEEPTEEELAEAAALARALDRGSAVNPPEDVLGAAALLRFSRDGAELSDERLDAILGEVMESARPQRPKVDARPWWRFLVPAGLVAAAAAAVLIMLPTPPTDTQLPGPSIALLRAQASSAAASDDEALDDAMASYRDEVLATIGARYE